MTSRSATDVSAPSPRTEDSPAAGTAPDRSWLWFVVVGVAVFVAQVVLTDMGRAPSWDEAVYLSQVDPDVPVLPFAASRARGIVVLVAPLAAADLSLTAIRVILALGSSAAVVAAAAAWRRVVGTPIAAAAAAVLGGTWLVLFYGAEVMPNLWTAILLVAACGLFARDLAGDRSRPSWPSLALLAGAAVVRPIDAVIVALVVAVIAMRRDADLGWVFGIPAAALVGVLPWLVEMGVRFGGPLEAMREAAEVGHVEGTSLIGTARLHLALADGPLQGPDAGPIPVVGVLWWIGVAWIAAWYGRRAVDPAHVGARIGLAATLGILLLYLVGVDGSAPRFLLPAIGLLVMAAAAGVTALPSQGRTGVGLAAIAWIVVQVGWLGPVHDAAAEGRAAASAAGAAVRSLVGPGDCLIVTPVDAPQLGYASGCRVRWVQDPTTFEPTEDVPTYIVTRTPGPGADVIVAGHAITDAASRAIFIAN